MLDQESRHHPLPCRRIRVNQSAKRAGLAPHDLAQARARLRHKDVVLRSVARAGDDAMLAADALRMERDAAHEECARLAEIVESKHWAAYEIARGLTLGDPTLTKHADGSVSIRWGSDREDAAIVTREALQSIVDNHNTLTAERDHALGVPVAQDQEDVVDAVIHCRGCFCPAEPDTVATLRLWERQRVREALREAGMHEAAALVAVLRHEATR